MDTNIRISPYLLIVGTLFSNFSYSLITTAQSSKPSAGIKENLSGTQNSESPTAESKIVQGYEIPNIKKRMQAVFPETRGSKKSELLPSHFGGTSFTGLVARLLGEGLNRTFEGIQTKQIIYYGVKKGQTVGLAHTATSELAGQLLHTIVYFSPGGTVKKVEVDGLAEKVAKEFEDQKILDQFAGHQTEAFEVIRGRRGRIVSKGIFLSQVKRPKSGEARQAFEKILRSVRFSSAFMDVAYFITQHPDQADKTTQEFPEGIQLTGTMPATGPEAYVDKKNIANPIDGNPFHPEEEEDEEESSE